MNWGSRLWIAGAVALLGVGALWLGTLSSEANVRQVRDVVEAPGTYASGEWVVVGVPQPAQIPVTTPTGVELRANPEYSDTISTAQRWSGGGVEYQSKIAARAVVDDGAWALVVRNETRRPGSVDLAFPATEHRIPLSSAPVAVQGFEDGQGTPPRMWAVLTEPPRDPMQPKPSQFTGRLAQQVGGVAIPQGVPIFEVSQFTAGCSSKFIPPAEQERLASEGL